MELEYGNGLSFLKVNYDAHYGVMSTPAVIVQNHSEPVEKLVGLKQKEVYEKTLQEYV